MKKRAGNFYWMKKRVYKVDISSYKHTFLQKKQAMLTEDIDTLIKELKQIKIKEREIIDAIQCIINTTQPVLSDSRVITPRAINVTIVNKSSDFVVGERIFITNAIPRPFGRTVNAGDRRAVITNITPTRITLTTENGTNTWRASKNIRKLQHYELMR